MIGVIYGPGGPLGCLNNSAAPEDNMRNTRARPAHAGTGAPVLTLVTFLPDTADSFQPRGEIRH